MTDYTLIIWLLIADYWLLIADYWLLIIDYWLLIYTKVAGAFV